ncbi:hypothetical protein F4861DRAFT_49238 [Xylaria intraflava]|nr:hypothetical protein F4861DRAFT_49238 [Xylaria intraflava]
MPWAANPVLESGDPTDRSADLEAARNRRSADTPSPGPKDDQQRLRPPSDHLTLHQFFYIFILDGIGAAAIAGGINFAIAYALYHDKGTQGSPIRLFQFPNTLAGDAAVTVFIQFLSTWLVEAVRVNLDLRKGAVQPIGFIPEPQWRFLRWYMFLDRQEQTDEVRSLMHWLRFIFSQLLRSLILVVVSFPFIFGACIGFLTLVGRRHGADWDWYFSATWAPEIFKLVQGAVLGLLFTPPMVCFWLVRCGWALRNMERESNASPETTYGAEQTS